MMNKPIFILACSPRSGSTWLQRCLTSTGDVLIWGETTLLNFEEPCLHTLSDKNPDNPNDLHKFREVGCDMWMAVLQPELDLAIKHRKEFIQNLYSEATEKEKFSRWGIKLTDFNKATIKFILEAWPKSQLVFIHREFEQCFKSRFKHNPSVQGGSRIADINNFCASYIRQTQAMLSVFHKTNVICVEYERLNKSWWFVEELCKELELGEPNKNKADTPISVSSHMTDSIDFEDLAVLANYRPKIDELYIEFVRRMTSNE